MSRKKKTLTEELLERMEAYCAARGLSPARVATLAVNDGDLFRRVRDGGTLTLKTYERVSAWLDQAERDLATEPTQ